ncbi:GtrA family protein [Luteimonas notoginsengisoli]|uniref:GtrA family protein n=1 Tax=Luteimonas notoginsengisoli TaxID=1578200 RepID=A0ABV7UQV4_9GAMM
MKALLVRALRLELFRFVIAGGINTLLTLALYWLLLAWFEYRVAYTISFVAGIVSGFALNTYAVFRVPWSWMRLLAFPSVHAVNYVVGLAIVWLSVRVFGIDERLAPVVAAVAIIPLNFMMTRLVIKPPAQSEQATDR